MTKSISFGYVRIFILSAFITFNLMNKILVQTIEKSSTSIAAERDVTGYLSVSKLQVNKNKINTKG